DQDIPNAHDALEAARILYPRYRARYHTRAEEIQLDYDLIRILHDESSLMLWIEKRKWLPPTDPYWQVAPTEAYDPNWELPKKLRYLFAQIQALAPTPHEAATARYAYALWLAAYQDQMRARALREEKGKLVQIPFPYQSESPMNLLRQLLNDIPPD